VLVRLTPEQVTRNWNEIAYAIKACLPPVVENSDDVMNSALSGLVGSELQCWVGVASFNGINKICGIVITKINTEFGTKAKNLVVLTLYGYTKIENSLWLEGLDTLRQFARDNGCSKIIGYTNVKRVVEVVEQLGGRGEFRLISLEV